MRVKFDDRLPIDHLFNPDDVGVLFCCTLDRFFHLRSDLRRVRCARAKHNLKTFVHELDRADEMNDSFLPRDPANEEQVRFGWIDSMALERSG